VFPQSAGGSQGNAAAEAGKSLQLLPSTVAAHAASPAFNYAGKVSCCDYCRGQGYSLSSLYL